MINIQWYLSTVRFPYQKYNFKSSMYSETEIVHLQLHMLIAPLNKTAIRNKFSHIIHKTGKKVNFLMADTLFYVRHLCIQSGPSLEKIFKVTKTMSRHNYSLKTHLLPQSHVLRIPGGRGTVQLYHVASGWL